MKKSFFSSIVSQIILLIFVIVWVIPTFGLLISSFRDKDLLATSGWWTSLFTTEINEIYRTAGYESQFNENNNYIIKGNLFNTKTGKKMAVVKFLWLKTLVFVHILNITN